MVVIPKGFPDQRFDFELEARSAAVNEACAGEAVECSIAVLCPECQALAGQIIHRLEKAFAAGRASTLEVTP